MIVVPCPERAERILQAGNMGCPRCPGRLRPFGHGRTRTVRGRGTATLRVTPRRARCGDCGGTQILLPATLTVRRADSTEVIGAALAATATVLSTRLGLVGTVIGAVVASVVSTLVSTVFVRWLERTHDRVTATRDAGPRLWQRLAVGALAVALVATIWVVFDGMSSLVVEVKVSERT